MRINRLHKLGFDRVSPIRIAPGFAAVLVIACFAVSGAYAEPCENTAAVSREATRFLITGNPLKALELLKDHHVSQCARTKSISAIVYAQLGDYQRADEIGGAYEPGHDATCSAEPRLADVKDWREALDERLSEAKIVVINELHYRPSNRAFAELVLQELAKKGFKYFAAEELNPLSVRNIKARGWAGVGDSPGLNEPVFASLVTKAQRLGYELVNYEWLQNVQPSTGDPRNDREHFQAANIIAATIAKDPTAKVIVYAGPGHAREDKGEPPFPTLYMAGWLKKLSRVDPFTISQSACPPLVMDRQKDRSAFVVVKHGKESANGVFDVIVRETAPFPSPDAWPEWFVKIGRLPVKVPLEASAVLDSGDFVAEARAASAPAQSTPYDRVLIEDGRPVRRLALSPGDYVVSVSNADGEVVQSEKLRVDRDGAASAY